MRKNFRQKAELPKEAGWASRTLVMSLLGALVLIPLVIHSAPPGWWQNRGILSSGATDDYAAINQGQLKNLVAASVSEMNAKLQGGAGASLNTLVSSWRNSSTNADDYAAVNIGQLRAVAKRVHARLLEAGTISTMPAWSSNSSPEGDNFALANIGQAKNLFSFAVPNQVSPGDGGTGGTGWTPPENWNGDAVYDPPVSAGQEALYSGIGTQTLGLSFNSRLE